MFLYCTFGVHEGLFQIRFSETWDRNKICNDNNFILKKIGVLIYVTSIEMKNNLTENKYDHPIVSDWLLGPVNPVQGEGKLWVLHIPTWENGGLLGAETTRVDSVHQD